LLDGDAQKQEYAAMRTTIDLPDDLFRQAKAKAALSGMKLKDLITRFVEQGLRQGTQPPAAPSKRVRSELPVARAATGRILPDLTNADIYRILEEEETAVGRSD
jgi:Arc/MetJ family transcription regulator